MKQPNSCRNGVVKPTAVHISRDDHWSVSFDTSQLYDIDTSYDASDNLTLANAQEVLGNHELLR